MRPEKSIVAITGAARGIGRATAERLARKGAMVAVGDIDGELAERVASTIGPMAVGIQVDVRDRQSILTFFEEAEKRIGLLTGFVNNAGIMPLGPFVSMDDVSTKATIDVNLIGVIYGMQIALEKFIERRQGKIVNVASMGGRVALPGAAVYTGTKFAVIGLTEAVRSELRGSGVNVSLILPTLVDTELGSGVPKGKGFMSIKPEDVARRICDVLELQKDLDVYIPSWMKAVDIGSRLTPSRFMRSIRKILDDDRVLTDLDINKRSSYDERLRKL